MAGISDQAIAAVMHKGRTHKQWIAKYEWLIKFGSGSVARDASQQLAETQANLQNDINILKIELDGTLGELEGLTLAFNLGHDVVGRFPDLYRKVAQLETAIETLSAK